MTGREDQPEQVVGHTRVEYLVDVSHRVRLLEPGRGFSGDAGELAVEVLLASVPVDRHVLGGGHEPGRRMVGDPVARPLAQSDLEGVLGQVLGRREVAGDAGEGGDEAA